jgi:hypothetical protein
MGGLRRVSCGRTRGLAGVATLLAALSACGDRTPLDYPSAPDQPSNGAPPCPSGRQVVYALDADGTLYRYDPITERATALGTPMCGNPNVPWTMTASSRTAYIVYTDWSIYAVDLATLACAPTAFQAGQLGIGPEFGVAVSETAGAEQFFVCGIAVGDSSPILAVGDTRTFVLTEVGVVDSRMGESSFPVNLTADSSGHLYAFSPAGLVQEIDAQTGSVLQAIDTGVTSSSTWATIAYGADLFLWVGSQVDGYDLSTQVVTSNPDVGISAIGAAAVGCSGG